MYGIKVASLVLGITLTALAVVSGLVFWLVPWLGPWWGGGIALAAVMAIGFVVIAVVENHGE